jgi:hypothetical protein
MASVREINTHVKDAAKDQASVPPSPLFVPHWRWGFHSAAARPDLARRCFCTETNLVRKVREHPAEEMSHDRDN